jgi:hypothetical protein
MSDPKTVRAAPRDADGGPAMDCKRGSLHPSHTATPKPVQEPPPPSHETVLAARNLTYEALVESAGIAESYARSLGEAAWRGDAVTVETHLRQLRACVVAAIDVFKMLNGVEKKGAGA